MIRTAEFCAVLLAEEDLDRFCGRPPSAAITCPCGAVPFPSDPWLAGRALEISWLSLFLLLFPAARPRATLALRYGEYIISCGIKSASGQQRSFRARPPLFLHGVDQFDIEIVLCQEKSDLVILERLARLRRNDEVRALLLQHRHLALQITAAKA